MINYGIFPEKVVSPKKADSGFIIAVILLTGLGLVTLYNSSATYGFHMFGDELHFVKRQLVTGSISLVCLLIFSFVNLDFIRKHLAKIVIFTLILCLLTFVPGIGMEKNGARRWIGTSSVSFQPAELVKMVIILFLANLFAKKHDRLDDPKATIFPAMIVLSIFVMLVYLQNDFSTAVFILLLGFMIFFLAGIPLRWFAGFVLFCLPLLFLFVFTEQYRVNRIIAYLNPGSDPYGSSYQLIAAQKAIASGGFWGKGIGGSLRKISSIPEVQADFIFAGWVEEMGFLGVIIYYLILLYFTWRGIKIALECCNRFRSLVAFGAVCAIFFQSLMNCGVVSGFFPSTGIPLPFFSSGGSSLLITLCLCGLVINVSRWNSSVENVYE